jgi:hypothetical protein
MSRRRSSSITSSAAAAAALLNRVITARTSRQRFRQLILKSAARVLLSGHRTTVVIEASHARLLNRLAREMKALYPALGSASPLALPTPA